MTKTYRHLPTMSNSRRLLDMDIESHEVTMRLTPAHIGALTELLEEAVTNVRDPQVSPEYYARLDFLAELFGRVDRDIAGLDRYQKAWKANADSLVAAAKRNR